MAKKKNKHKHSRFTRKQAVQPKVAASSALASSPSSSPAPSTASPQTAALKASATQPKPGILNSSNRWYYVSGDLRRISVLASLCIGLELVLWYALSYTSFGDSVYLLFTI
ncbi:MAG TPA: hypothetical protein VF272_01915 [Candidatus Saccharimonadia bacterium]